MDDRNEPATKGDLQEAIQKAKEEIVAEIIEVLRDVETKIIGLFYGYMNTTDKRVGGLENAEGVLLSRMAILEARVSQLERQQFTPPKPPEQ